MAEEVVIVGCDCVCAYGWGVDALWQGLLAGKTAIRKFDRFDTKNFQTQNAGFISDLKFSKNTSLICQMLEPLLEKIELPQDTFLILSSTTGEIELLENSALEDKNVFYSANLSTLLKKMQNFCRIEDGLVVSSACASGAYALAVGAMMIQSGRKKNVLVLSCDCVSEFVFAGFSSLFALDPDKAKPFDKNLKGLSIGESAGFALLMNAEQAKKENRQRLGKIAGWGLSCDANHMTGPSRDGAGLAIAIEKSLNSAKIKAQDIGSVSAHGTGTVYNDSMEIKALKKIFTATPIPVYSIKGGTGHTMASAGLLETITALKSLQDEIIPQTVGLEEIDSEFLGWVDFKNKKLACDFTLSVNSGFGGVNCALILEK